MISMWMTIEKSRRHEHNPLSILRSLLRPPSPLASFLRHWRMNLYLHHDKLPGSLLRISRLHSSPYNLPVLIKAHCSSQTHRLHNTISSLADLHRNQLLQSHLRRLKNLTSLLVRKFNSHNTLMMAILLCPKVHHQLNIKRLLIWAGFPLLLMTHRHTTLRTSEGTKIITPITRSTRSRTHKNKTEHQVLLGHLLPNKTNNTQRAKLSSSLLVDMLNLAIPKRVGALLLTPRYPAKASRTNQLRCFISSSSRHTGKAVVSMVDIHTGNLIIRMLIISHI